MAKPSGLLSLGNLRRGWVHGWVGGWVGAWVGGCMGGWVGGCMGGWVGGCMGGWLAEPWPRPNPPPPRGSLSNSLDQVLVRINVQNFTNTQSRTVHIQLADIHLRD